MAREFKELLEETMPKSSIKNAKDKAKIILDSIILGDKTNKKDSVNSDSKRTFVTKISSS